MRKSRASCRRVLNQLRLGIFRVCQKMKEKSHNVSHAVCVSRPKRGERQRRQRSRVRACQRMILDRRSLVRGAVWRSRRRHLSRLDQAALHRRRLPSTSLSPLGVGKKGKISSTRGRARQWSHSIPRHKQPRRSPPRDSTSRPHGASCTLPWHIPMAHPTTRYRLRPVLGVVPRPPPLPSPPALPPLARAHGAR